MKAFTALYRAIDESTGTNDKLAALERYFLAAPPGDAAWALHVLTGNRPKRMIGSRTLRECAAAAAGVAPWLLDACYEQVGDIAETVALLTAGTTRRTGQEGSLQYWIEERLLSLRDLDEAGQCRALQRAWTELDASERLVWNKLLTGAFRVGVAAKLVTRAVARAAGIDEQIIAHRLMGAWSPTPDAWNALIASDSADADHSRPYPFALATALDQPPDALGAPDAWIAEWKWDGIRAQLVRRHQQAWLWSRGEELLAGRFPEIEAMATTLPEGTVLDGEILAWMPDSEVPLPFAQLQRRIQRKTVSRAMLASVPVIFVAYDLLESGGVDWRDRPLTARRAQLEAVLSETGHVFRISPMVTGDSWQARVDQRLAARAAGAEGLMLKRANAAYLTGRKRGGWWKWKVDPLSVDAVLIGAQPGSGRRAGLFTDYTFGVWDGDALIPFAKAYSGLTDAEIRRVDAFVRRHTRERFGPVRMVEPTLVFEIAFEGIQRSTRHKSGIAVRFPRIARWRDDKTAADADTLDTVRALLDVHG
jgi:DNA ligase-1